MQIAWMQFDHRYVKQSKFFTAMNCILVRPSSPIAGDISVPGDKSISHRAVILGALAQGETIVEGNLPSEDVLATIEAFRSCGIEIEVDGQTALIHGKGLYGLQKPAKPIDCGNSGTAMRLLMGVFAGQEFSSVLVGDESLTKRPMKRVAEPLARMGANIALSGTGTAPVIIDSVDQLKSVNWRSSVASAQVKSAILLAGLYAKGRTTVSEPHPTRDHTELMLAKFGYEIQRADSTASITGQQEKAGTRIVVPGDFSSAAFFILGALLHPNSDLTIRNVGMNPLRTGFKTVMDRSANGAIQVSNWRDNHGEPSADIRIRGAEKLTKVSIEPDEVPGMIDELPLLAIAGAFADGESSIRHCQELRVKESDRIHSTATGLQQLNARVREVPDGWTVNGGSLNGGEVDSFKDHRIAMGFAMAATRAKNKVLIRDTDCILTSFPGFEQLAMQVGVDLEVCQYYMK